MRGALVVSLFLIGLISTFLWSNYGSGKVSGGEDELTSNKSITFNESNERPLVPESREDVSHPEISKTELIPDKNKMHNIAGKQYILGQDCAYDIAQNVYEMIENDLRGKAWLEDRGYHLFYHSSEISSYQSFDKKTLDSLAENGNPVAMSRVAINHLFDENDDGQSYVAALDSMFLETGNFAALNLLTMNFDFIDIPLQEKMNWLALKKELHGLDIFGYSSIGLPSLTEKNKLWAKEKIKEIDLYRTEHGLARIPKNPLPQDLIREIDVYKEFVSQEDELRMWGECP